MPGPAPFPGQGVGAYLHALRRRWLIATFAAAVCGVAAAVGTWTAYMPKYTVASLLQVSSQEQRLVFETADRADAATFEIYKSTQAQLLRSRFVIHTALRQHEVAELPLIERHDDPVSWLADELRVDFPGNAEIMRVSLRGDHPQQLAAMVDAVVEAYMREVVEAERNRRRERLADLDRIHAETETEFRTRQSDLKSLAEQLGTGDPEALLLDQLMARQQLAALQSELVRLQLDLGHTEAELQTRRAALRKGRAAEVSETALDAFAVSDPVAQRMRGEVERLGQLVAATEAVATEATRRFVTQSRHDLDAAKQRLAARRSELRKELLRRQRASAEAEAATLEKQIALISVQREQLAEEAKRQAAKSKDYGGSSVDIEMMRTEIGHLSGVLSTVAEERERLKVELRSGPRIRVVQRAEVPQATDDAARLRSSVMAGLMGVLLPILGITWWETRRQRINNSAEVSRGLGLAVLGAVPLIPARAVRRLHTHGRCPPYWRALLTRSVDAVAAVLLRKAQTDGTRVVLVSSAMAGEGKTTLASQLALSIARSQRRTVLVDFDVGRPALGSVFRLPPGPGVGELLRGEASVPEVTHRVAGSDLDVVLAGRWNRQAQARLTNGAAEALVAGLRAEYEFVIIDSSPILTGVDSRFIGQHVDGAILSVLRDVSQAPRVLASRDVLDAFGIPFLGTVVAGSSSEVYGLEADLNGHATS